VPRLLALNTLMHAYAVKLFTFKVFAQTCSHFSFQKITIQERQISSRI
jgi:hypothetical protein